MGFQEKERQRKKEKGVVSKIVGGMEEGAGYANHSKYIKKKPGRSKLNRETKQRYTLTLVPSNHDRAAKIAYHDGKSVSELIDELLAQYVKKNAAMLNK